MASLIVKEGQNKGQVFKIVEDEMTIGRGEGNTIRIQDKAVSSYHCYIKKQGSSYYLKDLNSTNGTFVNQKQVKDVKLSSGDRVSLGKTLFLFQKDEEEIGQGITTVLKETSDEMDQGKGYETILGETVKEIIEHDLNEAVKKAEETGEDLEGTLEKLGWTDNDADKIAGDHKGVKYDDFPAELVIEKQRPKPNECIIKLKRKIENIEAGNIVVCQGKDYLVLEVRKEPATSFVTYRLKAC